MNEPDQTWSGYHALRWFISQTFLKKYELQICSQHGIWLQNLFFKTQTSLLQ